MCPIPCLSRSGHSVARLGGTVPVLVSTSIPTWSNSLRRASVCLQLAKSIRRPMVTARLFTIFRNKDVARSWLRRVREWSSNLRKDLTQDSAPVPGASCKRWLLFQSSKVSADPHSGAISCRLCKMCRGTLLPSPGFPTRLRAAVPYMSRADGLWHGPDPAELQVLSYAECKVINLARVYVSAKRVYLSRHRNAGTSAREVSLYR